ncbi:uncharacterized protein LOC115999306 [Ipomoea triloba]|uniref:uncharacterized protein LOC115999306 n=1 Tax=Ipomoea triloba TaxID=35885 RepID=UPI00125D888E|nr:uncharacterized protein LOC115999306 [Ipomoea triloba]
MVEARAIAKGLQWVWNRGIRDLEVQIDATEVLNWITDHTMLRGPARVIVEDIRGWQMRFRKLVLRSIFREQNIAADRLATIRSSQETNWKDHIDPPVGLNEILTDEMMGIPCMRMVVCNNHA